jgi:hypothetical protein
MEIPYNVVALKRSKMPNPLNAEAVSDQFYNLFFCEVIPSRSISITETHQKIDTFRVLHSIDFDKCSSLSSFHVMETAYIKNKPEIIIFERKRQETSHKKIQIQFFVMHYFFRELHCAV